MRPAALALLVLVGACGGGGSATLAPVVDSPDPSSPAYPWTDLATLTLQVTHAGASGITAEKSFARGQPPSIDVDFADDLVVHLSGARADGVELAYGRSCAVTARADALPTVAPHLYFARIVRWADGARPTAPARTGGAAWTAPDGSGLWAGGDGDETSIERFDTLHGAFAPVAGASEARRGSVLAPLPDGSALRIGGAVGGDPVPFFELLSPSASATVQRVDDDRFRLVDHAAATLVDGSVVVAGGRTPAAGGGLAVTGATWTLRLGDAGAPARPQLMAAALATPRAAHTLTRLGDEVGAAVLAIGGQDAAGLPVAAAELWEPLREAYADFHPAMVRPRYGHRAQRLPDGSILVVGGIGPDGPEATIEVYRPRVGQFVAAGTLPAGAGLTEESVVALPDGRVLLAGGRDRSGAAVATTLIAQLDPIDGKVVLSPTGGLAVPRAGHAATLLCDGTVLLVGGTGDPAAPGSERYNPPAAGRR